MKSKQVREQALRELREANDVLSRRVDTSRMSVADRATYEEGLRLTRLKQQDANKRLG